MEADTAKKLVLPKGKCQGARKGKLTLYALFIDP
jgi:hypothetical protein